MPVLRWGKKQDEAGEDWLLEISDHQQSWWALICKNIRSDNYELPRRERRGILRNIYNRPKGRGMKPLSALYGGE